jgi:putative SOS response-associated peptidase YedK
MNGRKRKSARFGHPIISTGKMKIWWQLPDFVMSGTLLKGGQLLTFVIIPTEPNSLVSSYHDRMPAILRYEEERRWLEPGQIPGDAVREILSPYPKDLLEAYRVSRLVNDPANEGSDLI